MGQILLYTILTLCSLGVLAAIILYFVARKFYVYEDPRIDTVESMLPGANCGGCGFPGCRGFADALVKSDNIEPLYCPVGGATTMKDVAEFLGKSAPEKEPHIAVVRCGGSCDKRQKTNTFDGAASCAVISSLYGGESTCNWGCLSKGDCVVACNFDAIYINPETGLPVVDEEKCTACGACVKACPKMLIELRKKGPKGRRVFVSCRNMDKGAIARKSCQVACIACSKCVKTCPFEAITIENNLAYIDPDKCKLCRKCVPECPTNAIWEVNFPPRKEKSPTDEKPGTVKSVGEKSPEKGKPADPRVDDSATATKNVAKERSGTSVSPGAKKNIAAEKEITANLRGESVLKKEMMEFSEGEALGSDARAIKEARVSDTGDNVNVVKEEPTEKQEQK